MKTVFSGHYRPEQNEIEQMWAEGTFVFDANALLNLYRYTEATRDSFIESLVALRERVWIPYQVGFEFFKNRATVMSSAALGYSKLCNDLAKARKDLGAILNAFRRHPGIDVEDISKKLDETFSTLDSELKAQEAKHPDWIAGQDPVLERLTGVFDGRVGGKPTLDEYNRFVDQAKKRFESSTPPGFMDKEKGGIQQYGDAILWLEILQKASELKTAIIFVTDDIKDDWWQRVGGKIIGPLPELRQEIRDVANVPLHMYQCDQFLRYASEFLKRKLPESSIEEAKEVRDELQRESLEDRFQRLFNEQVSSPSDSGGEMTSPAWLQIAPESNDRDNFMTVAHQKYISRLISSRNRLRQIILDMPNDARQSKEGIGIVKSLDIIERRLQREERYLSAATLNDLFGKYKEGPKLE